MPLLPSLGALRLGPPTKGLEALQFWKRATGKEKDDDAHRKTVEELNVLGLTRQPTRSNSQNELLPKDKKWLEDFVEALRDTNARKDDDLRVMWRQSVIDQMEYKRGYYQQRAARLRADADDEREKLNRVVRSYTAGGESAIFRGNNVNATWDILKENNKLALFDAYIAMAADAEKIKDAAISKKNAFTAAKPGKVPQGARDSVRGDPSSPEFNALCKQLADAIEDLYTTYPSQDDLLNAMASNIAAFVENPEISRRRSFNFVVMGNAGVGKTRLARLVGKALGALGMYVYSDTLEIDKTKLVAEYEGQTAPLAKRTLASGLEKTVFLDEAYSVTIFDVKDGGRRVINPYSADAVVEMLTHLEGQRGNTTFIAAGYERQMKEDFLASNEGMTSRFTNFVRMQDYKPNELKDIFLRSLAQDFVEEGSTLAEATKKVSGWFAADALEFMEYVLCTSKGNREAYHNINEVFKSQARRMVTMAGIASALVTNSGYQDKLGTNDTGDASYVLSPHDVYRIITNMIEAEEGEEGGKKYVAELTQIAIQGMWRNDAGNWGVPSDNAPGCKRALSGGAAGPSSADSDDPESTPGAYKKPTLEPGRTTRRSALKQRTDQ